MPDYKVKPGKSFGPGGCYPAGTILELTKVEAEGFLDKLERVTTVTPVPQPQPAPVGLQNELGAHVPDELKILPAVEEPAQAPAPEPEQAPARSSKSKTQRKKATED